VIGNKDSSTKNLSDLGPVSMANSSLPVKSAIDVLNVMGDAKTRKLNGHKN
jgi:hypothetical protein